MKRLLLLSLFLFSQYSNAKVFMDVKFQDKVKLQGKELILNGVGLRTAALFNSKVYIAGLYLEKKEKDAKKILNSKSSKVLILHFLRDINSEKLTKSFIDGFKTNKVDTDIYKKELDYLIKDIDPAKPGTRLVFQVYDKTVDFFQNKKFKRVKKKGFGKDLLRIWLDKAPNLELKAGLLGTKVKNIKNKK
jgi:hypothetical protein